MINLIKHEVRLRSKFSVIALSIYLIEHLYVAFKISDNMIEETFFILLINTFFTTLILMGVTFMHSIVDYNSHLKPKPGYMLLMANVSRREFIIAKLGVIFSETFIIGLIAMASFFIQFIAFDLFEMINSPNFEIGFHIQNGDIQYAILHFVRMVFFLSIEYLIAISIFIFAITLKTFLLNGRKFGGILTFLIAGAIIFIKSFTFDIINLDHSQIIGRFSHHHNSVSTVSAQMMVYEVVSLALLIIAIIYLVEKKLDV